jgi:hypothetical protein
MKTRRDGPRDDPGSRSPNHESEEDDGQEETGDCDESRPQDAVRRRKRGDVGAEDGSRNRQGQRHEGVEKREEISLLEWL